MVPPSSDQVSRVWPYSGSCSAAPVFTYVTLTLSGGPSHTLQLTVAVLIAVHTPQVFPPTVWPLPRSLATTYGISFDVSSSPYLDVSVQAVPSVYLWIQYTVPEVCSGGFPHSDICGSMLICSSPQLFAAYHVFLRLPVPRHSPCALFSLTVFLLILLICQRDLIKIVVNIFLKSLRSLLFSFQGASVAFRPHLPPAAPERASLHSPFHPKVMCLCSAFASHKRESKYSQLLSVSPQKVVGSSGLEPPTSRLSGARSNHLSYEPILVEIRRLELLTPCLQSRCSPS